MLETNNRLPLSHMAKGYIWLEEANQHINEFSIGYRMNPNLNTKKHFQRASEGMFEKHIWYIYNGTYR